MSVVEQVLQARAFKKETVDVIVNKALRQTKFLHEMYANGAGEQTVRDQIETYVPQILTFMQKHFQPETTICNKL